MKRMVKVMISIIVILLCLVLIFKVFGNKTESKASLIRYVDPLFDKVSIEKNIAYADVINSKGDNEKLMLDIYQPMGDKEINRPVIVWIHGGGFNSGTKDYGFEQDLAMDYTKKGYVCVSINYRLIGEDDHDMEQAMNNAMDDAAAAVAWIEKNSVKYQMDKQHIALGGHSAGATIATNMIYLDQRDNDSWPKKSIFAVIDLAGGRVFADQFEPTDPPAIIIHGSKDTFIPNIDNEDFARNLTNSNIPNTYLAIPDAGHFLIDQINEVEDSITPFLYKLLTGKEVIMQQRIIETPKVKEYKAKQLIIQIDGVLNEWKGSDTMQLDQLKIGDNRTDFSGTAQIGWNVKEPTRLYIAVQIKDDTTGEIHHGPALVWEDNAIEFMIDYTKNGKTKHQQPLSWIIADNDKDTSAYATKENTHFKVIKNGNLYTYEAAIDLSLISNFPKPNVYSDFKAIAGDYLGLDFHYNHADKQGKLQSQYGWTAQAAYATKYNGKVIFDSKSAL